MVHPDKCSHPQAHQAFVQLNKAFKELQDPDKVCVLKYHGFCYIGYILISLKQLKNHELAQFAMLTSSCQI